MDLTSELSAIIPSPRVLTRFIERIAYADDASYFRLIPQAVVQPASIDEIRSLFRFSQQQRIPMTFRAAGTSLSGQACTDGILVDVSKHWRKIAVEDDGACVRVEPGLIGSYVNAVLKPYGRRIGPDPASLDACMIGGILANNSSGMCCGVTENAYRTVRSMKVVLPNGFILDTAASDAEEQLAEGAPEIFNGILALKERLLADGDLTRRVHTRYQMKNNNGYLLNAFLDFESPLDILAHLMIGSEGTLGFIAEAVLNTLPDYPRKYTGQLYFKTVQDAASAIAPLRQSGARAAEIMDRASLRSVEDMPGVPEVLRHLPETAAAILVEYQSAAADEMGAFRHAAEGVCRELRLLHEPEFTEDPARQAALWKPRKGIIPSVGAMRAPGTTSLIEDVAFPVPRLADAVTDLQRLFAEHGYPEGVIFGHAKDGNLHFLINQSFNTQDDIRRFERFTGDLVATVSGKYDGALKAEHGTGRNMAPFVETEWGATAYAIMRDLKSLFDPSGMLSPGVLINPDQRAHMTDLKSIPTVAPDVDKCIECGFCESKCPSRGLTLTPRQRIVVRREIARQQLAGSTSPLLGSLLDDYDYAGVETCAVDGLCATACPVGINTGELTRRLRVGSVSPHGEKAAGWIAGHFGFVERMVGWGVRLGHVVERLEPRRGAQGDHELSLARLTRWVEKHSGQTLPKWNAAIPYPTRNLRVLRGLGGERDFVYFPSCISRQLGTPRAPGSVSLAETLVTVAGRANASLWIPPDVEGHCCGMPFNSKGYLSAYQATLHRTLVKMWEWSDGGKLPVVIDTTSCAHTLRTCADMLSPEDKDIWDRMILLDSIEFIHDTLLSRLTLHPVDGDVVLHPNCSARKLNLQDKLTAIARRCARSASVPVNLDCCGFAGDRGLLFPELTASATALESAEVNARTYDGYYSSNITCEMGMSAATGQDYRSIAYLVERASRE
jgi:D-lactate dehydrogenase